MATGDAATLYYFDCLDGALGEHFWSLDDLAAMFNAPGDMGEYAEADALRLARNLEAALYRCSVVDGGVVDSVCLYDPFDCF